MKTRSWWGWGWEEDALTDAECVGLGALAPGTSAAPLPVPDLADVAPPAPRLTAPASLAKVVSAEPADRVAHTMGKVCSASSTARANCEHGCVARVVLTQQLAPVPIADITSLPAGNYGL